MDEYERVILVKPEVFVYRIPPLQSNRGYRAADWGLDKPDWKGRLRVVSKGQNCYIRLEDNSGELFGQCSVVKYPGTDVEQVKDSSRYFVIRLQDDSGTRSAFIGIGFADRGDSFDLNVALQDHFKWVNKSEKPDVDKSDIPKLDLAFKEGQTITIKNMNFSKKQGKEKHGHTSSSGIGLLPPPPGGNIPLLAPPPTSNNTVLLSADDKPRSPSASNASESDPFGDFASAGDGDANPTKPSQQQTDWIHF